MIKSESVTRRVKITKRMMKDALIEMMEEKSLAAISVTDLCKLADVNRSTFYSYYDDVLQLLVEIENDLVDQLPISTHIDEHVDQNNQLVEEFTLFFAYVHQHKRDFNVLLQAGRMEFSERLTRIIMERFPQREKGGKNKRKTRWGYIYSMNGVIGVMKDWIREDFPISDKEFAQFVLEMSFRANQFNDE